MERHTMIKGLIKSKSIKNPKKGTLNIDILRQPVTIKDLDKNQVHHLKIDKAITCGSRAIIVGWCSLPEAIFCTDANAKIDSVDWHLRDDVTVNLGLPEGREYGFAILLETYSSSELIKVGVTSNSNKEPSTLFDINTESLLPVDFDVTAVEFRMLKHINCPFSPGQLEFSNYMSALPVEKGECSFARAYLEAVVVCEGTNEGIVVGWLAQAPGTQVWLEDEEGKTFSIDHAFRLDRADVRNAIAQKVNFSVVNSGFCCHIKGIKADSKIQLKALGDDGIYLIAEYICQPLSSDPIEAARWLSSVNIPQNRLHERMSKVDGPLLTQLMDLRQAQWENLPIYVRDLGEIPASPKVSVIIPLYGRTDFIEHQLMEFAEDEWFKRHVELIYVLDDPRLVEGFPAQAEALYRIYNIPFKWVWGSVNRGFSGANNLGTLQANGEFLLYLNSDAFPRQPGWVEKLMMELKQNPDIGAIAPRLLFADGGIQHAGMEFLRREELGIWINHHPRMGLDPALDPHKKITTVPAVTGACLMVRRKDFDALDGWDTGYLIGDFEDSDLCLKLRNAGLTIGYLPSVELTHLERQSFKLLGGGDFRTYVVILNATRHQNRWLTLLNNGKSEAISINKLAEAN